MTQRPPSECAIFLYCHHGDDIFQGLQKSLAQRNATRTKQSSIGEEHVSITNWPKNSEAKVQKPHQIAPIFSSMLLFQFFKTETPQQQQQQFVIAAPKKEGGVEKKTPLKIATRQLAWMEEDGSWPTGSSRLCGALITDTFWRIPRCCGGTQQPGLLLETARATLGM